MMKKGGQPVANNADSPLKAGDNMQQEQQEQPNEENIQDFM